MPDYRVYVQRERAVVEYAHIFEKASSPEEAVQTVQDKLDTEEIEPSDIEWYVADGTVDVDPMATSAQEVGNGATEETS